MKWYYIVMNAYVYIKSIRLYMHWYIHQLQDSNHLRGRKTKNPSGMSRGLHLGPKWCEILCACVYVCVHMWVFMFLERTGQNIKFC